MSEGEPLVGDGVTQGIVRIGDTVRRPLRPFSLTIQAYLAHLRDGGFTGAPQPLGVDEYGREVLSFVAGDVPGHPLPAEAAGDDVLVALARLIRGLHEASAGWVPPPEAVWGGTPATQGRRVIKGSELVSHCDYYPGNVVFRDGLPVALIDFDLAGPGSAVWDFAAAAHYWAPLYDEQDITDSRQGRVLERFRIFLHASGLRRADRRQVAEAVVANHDWTYAIVTEAAAAGHRGFADHWRMVAEHATRARRWCQRYQRDLIAAAR